MCVNIVSFTMILKNLKINIAMRMGFEPISGGRVTSCFNQGYSPIKGITH